LWWSEESSLIRWSRTASLVLGVGLFVLGVVVFDGEAFASLLPQWSWLLGAVVGGGAMGAGLGMGVGGLTGENRFLDRLRTYQEDRESLRAKADVDRIAGPDPADSRSRKRDAHEGEPQVRPAADRREGPATQGGEDEA
jgi:hypothetical protein